MRLFAFASHLSHGLSGDLAFVLLGLLAASVFVLQRRSAAPAASRAALSVLAFGAADLLMLAALPVLGLSFGPTRLSLLLLTTLRAGVWVGLLPAGWGIGYAGRYHPAFLRLAGAGLPALWIVHLAISALALYALYVEPFDLRVTQVEIATPEIHAARPIRIVHLSDIHIERITRREREMLATVQALQPDLIVLTGDYVNIDYVHDERARRETRQALSQLSAPYGVYAISGSLAVDTPEVMAEVFDGRPGLPIRILNDERVRVEAAGAALELVGVSLGRKEANRAALQSLMEPLPPQAYTILLHHTPDLAEAAADAGVDLYLAGHTHGGQIRLPGWGAIVTMSAYGKRFEAGRYSLGGMQMYVSRGIGMEGLRLPRARFLAPPEIVLIELRPASGGEAAR